MPQISVEKVREWFEFSTWLNSFDLSEIEWTENGKPLVIDPKIVEEFKFTGLSNREFIVTDYYLGERGEK